MGNIRLLNSEKNTENNNVSSILVKQDCPNTIKSLMYLYGKLYFMESFSLKYMS